MVLHCRFGEVVKDAEVRALECIDDVRIMRKKKIYIIFGICSVCIKVLANNYILTALI